MTLVAVRTLSTDLMDCVLRRLGSHHPLSHDEECLIRGLSDARGRHEAGVELAAEGAVLGRPRFLLRGWAACQRTLPDGRRQTFRLVLPGDIIGLEAGRGPPGWAVVSLTRAEVVSAVPAIDAAQSGRAPGLARAFAMQIRLEERLLLDQIIRTGALVGYERVAHLLLELRDRLAAAGLGDRVRFPLPLTQEHLASILGLSAVHVNRVLRALRNDGSLDMRGGEVTLLRPERLAAAACRAPSMASRSSSAQHAP